MNKFNKFCKLLQNNRYDKIFNSAEYSYLLLIKLENSITFNDKCKALKCIFSSPRSSLLYLEEMKYNNEEKEQAIKCISQSPRKSCQCLSLIKGLSAQNRNMLLETIINDSTSCLLALQTCNLSEGEKNKLILSVINFKVINDIINLTKTIKLSKDDFEQCFNIIAEDMKTLRIFIYDINNIAINNLFDKHITIIVNKIVKFRDLNLAQYILQTKDIKLSTNNFDKLNALVVFNKLSENN